MNNDTKYANNLIGIYSGEIWFPTGRIWKFSVFKTFCRWYLLSNSEEPFNCHIVFHINLFRMFRFYFFLSIFIFKSNNSNFNLSIPFFWLISYFLNFLTEDSNLSDFPFNLQLKLNDYRYLSNVFEFQILFHSLFVFLFSVYFLLLFLFPAFINPLFNHIDCLPFVKPRFNNLIPYQFFHWIVCFWDDWLSGAFPNWLYKSVQFH